MINDKITYNGEMKYSASETFESPTDTHINWLCYSDEIPEKSVFDVLLLFKPT